MTKNGLRSFDVRRRWSSSTSTGPTLRLVLAHGVPLVRADDVLRALVGIDPAVGVPTDAVLTRLAQGPLDRDTGEVGDPLA